MVNILVIIVNTMQSKQQTITQQEATCLHQDALTLHVPQTAVNIACC
jgi:hypothetical protein